MVRTQLRGRGILDERVLQALERVPRHRFVPSGLVVNAYDDGPLPIGQGQTISQPWIVARMTELLQLRGVDKVLELGTGSGYQTAVLSELAREVYSVERLPALAANTRTRLTQLGYHNVTVDCFDGTHGWAEHAPYDRILVTAGTPRVPPLLLDQLADGGRLVVPLGARDDQRLTVITRRGRECSVEQDANCRFVDLVGQYGFGGPGAARA
jgi:protein-L-isoaspartate(D-aspartate) O-methyltransferase